MVHAISAAIALYQLREAKFVWLGDSLLLVVIYLLQSQ